MLTSVAGAAVPSPAIAGRDWVSREHWRRCETQPLLPGVADRLAEARTIGLKTAVASSSEAAWVRPWLERHDLLDAFDAVCTRDDVTAVKPAPDLFLLAARRLGVPPEACLVFEDSPNGLRAARAAGMWAIAVPNGLTQPLEFPPHDLALESLAIAHAGQPAGGAEAFARSKDCLKMRRSSTSLSKGDGVSNN